MPETPDTPKEEASPAQPGAYVDPYRAYDFRLELQETAVGYFTEVQGLGVRVEALRFREGGDGRIVHRLPGRVEYGDVTLRYGLTPSTTLWDWFMEIVAGKNDPRHVSLLMLDEEGGESMRWDLYGAWPREWQGPPLDALGQQVAIETLVLTFESLERR